MWVPQHAHEIMWPNNGLHAQPRQITKVMELNRSHIDWEFIGTHEIKHIWNNQLGPMCLHIDSHASSTGGDCTKMLNHLCTCTLMMLHHHKHLVAHA